MNLSKKRLALMLCMVFTVGFASAAMLYTWTSTPFNVGTTQINGTVTVTATFYEVGYPISVAVNITNNRNANSTGYLTVTIESSATTVATLLNTTQITIPPQGTYNNSWNWTPTQAGTYSAKAMYEEA